MSICLLGRQAPLYTFDISLIFFPPLIHSQTFILSRSLCWGSYLDLDQHLKIQSCHSLMFASIFYFSIFLSPSYFLLIFVNCFVLFHFPPLSLPLQQIRNSVSEKRDSNQDVCGSWDLGGGAEIRRTKRRLSRG